MQPRGEPVHDLRRRRFTFDERVADVRDVDRDRRVGVTPGQLGHFHAPALEAPIWWGTGREIIRLIGERAGEGDNVGGAAARATADRNVAFAKQFFQARLHFFVGGIPLEGFGRIQRRVFEREFAFGLAGRDTHDLIRRDTRLHVRRLRAAHDVPPGLRRLSGRGGEQEA